MAISYNTGTTSFVTNSGTASGTLTIPAGVLNGDWLLVFVSSFTTATGTLTNTLTSSATTPVAVGTQVNTGINAGIQVQTAVWKIQATGSDASATLTYGTTGGSGGSYWFDVGLVAYTGAGGVDVSNGSAAYSASFNSTSGTVTTPSATTTIDGDWQVQLLMVAPFGNSVLNVPGSLTGRQSIIATTNAGLLLSIADSNASVGAHPQTIGNTGWSVTGGSGSGNMWNGLFTVGIQPASGATTIAGQSQQSVMLLARQATSIAQFTQIPAPPPALPAPSQAVTLLQRGLAQTLPSPQVPPPTPPLPATQQAATLMRLGLPVSPQSPQVPGPPPPLPAPQQSSTLVRLGLPQTLPSPQTQPPAPPLPAPQQSLTLVRAGLPQQTAANQVPGPPPPPGPQPQSLLFVQRGMPTPGNFFQTSTVVVITYSAGQPPQAMNLMLQGLPQQQAAAATPGPVPPLPAPLQSVTLIQRGLATPGNFAPGTAIAPPVIAQPGQQQATTLLQIGLPTPGNFAPGTAVPPPVLTPGIQQQQAVTFVAAGRATAGNFLQLAPFVPPPPPPSGGAQQATTLLRRGLAVPSPSSGTQQAGPQQGTVAIVNQRSALVTIVNAPAYAVTISNQPQGTVTVVNTI